jgi:peroxiredoxin
VWVVSMDSAEELRALRDELGLPFTYLSDPKGEIVDRYGLRHADGGPHGTPTAIPANVLVAKGGRIAWRHNSSRITVRPSPDDVLAEIAKL